MINKNRSKKIIVIVFLVMLSIVLLVVSELLYFHKYLNRGVDYSTGWKLDINSKITENYTLKDNMKKKAGTKATLERKLPNDFKGGDSLFFCSQSIAFTIYLEDKPIYKYGYNTGRIDTSPGDYVHFVKLPENSEGKNVKICITFPYKNASHMIKSINIVDDKQMLITYERTHLALLIINIFMMMMGIVCLICDGFMLNRVFGNHCLRHMSIFLVFLAAWSGTQIKLSSIVFGIENYHSSLSFITFSFLPIPLFAFIAERYNLNKLKNVKILKSVLIIMFLSVHLLNYIGVFVYAESVIITQVSLAITALFLIFVSVKYFNTFKNLSSSTLLHFGITCLVILGICDVVNYYKAIMIDYSFFSRFGLLIFVLCIFMDVMISSVNLIELGEDSERNMRLAITDSLTGLYNRTAYDEKLEELRKIPLEKLEVGIIEFDVNNLKKVNDTYGHNVGDTLIIESGRIIGRSCIGYGEAYRIGGDEFTIIISKKSTECISEIIDTFKQMIEETNDRLGWDIPVSIAYGKTIFKCNRDKGIEDAIKRADKLMYEMKRKMKQER